MLLSNEKQTVVRMECLNAVNETSSNASLLDFRIHDLVERQELHDLNVHFLANINDVKRNGCETEINLSGINQDQIVQVPRKIFLRTIEKPSSYADLICTEDGKNLIKELTSILAEHNYFWFLTHSQELKEKVKALKKQVHVLKIFEIAFTNSKLAEDILKIYNNSSKWDIVVKETNKKMQKLEDEGILHVYMNDFAAAIGIHAEQVHEYFLKKDSAGFLTHLINRLKFKDF